MSVFIIAGKTFLKKIERMLTMLRLTAFIEFKLIVN